MKAQNKNSGNVTSGSPWEINQNKLLKKDIKKLLGNISASEDY